MSLIYRPPVTEPENRQKAFFSQNLLQNNVEGEEGWVGISCGLAVVETGNVLHTNMFLKLISVVVRNLPFLVIIFIIRKTTGKNL